MKFPSRALAGAAPAAAILAGCATAPSTCPPPPPAPRTVYQPASWSELIRGPVRADYFSGIGAQAAAQAGIMRQPGRMWLIWPKGEPLPRG